MKVLVTGGGGFIAGHLLPALRGAGHEVTAVDNRPATATEFVDIREPSSLEKLTGFEAVFHMAAIAVPDICAQHQVEAFNTNVRGTYNVLNWARRTGVKKFVFVSSAHVYGISPLYLPTKENHPLALHDVYTTTKILGERLCWLFYENYGMPFTTLRLFNAYGPGQTFNYFLPSMIAKASVMKKVVLYASETTKDFVYITDVVGAFLKALDSEYVGEVNVGSGKETRLRAVAETIANHFGATVIPADVQPPVTRMQADVSKARSALGWEPLTTLEDGLEKTIEAFQS